MSKISDIRRPVLLWVVLDENPNTINDGSFRVPTGNNWIDFPATYHNRAGGLNFADGHAEIYKWRDSAVLAPKAIGDYSGRPATPPYTNLRWLQERTANL
jgi:hypothetical protein